MDRMGRVSVVDLVRRHSRYSVWFYRELGISKSYWDQLKAGGKQWNVPLLERAAAILRWPADRFIEWPAAVERQRLVRNRTRARRCAASDQTPAAPVATT